MNLKKLQGQAKAKPGAHLGALLVFACFLINLEWLKQCNSLKRLVPQAGL